MGWSDDPDQFAVWPRGGDTALSTSADHSVTIPLTPDPPPMLAMP